MIYYWFFVFFEIILYSVFCVNGESDCTLMENYEICCENETLISVKTKKYDSSQSLYLYDKKIYKIKSNAFKNLTIKNLVIKDTESFMDIEIGSFKGLPNLQAIELRAGSIMLNPNTFYEIKNIKNLTMSIYNIGTNFTESLSILKSLKNINIYNSNLGFLDGAKFRKISSDKIESFECRKCNIVWIYPMTFYSFKNLHVLALDDNDLGTLNPNIFYGLSTSLYSLSLKSTKLTIIEDNTFNNLLKLQVLDLSNNFIENIPVNFIRNTWIRKLSLVYNRISHLRKGVFTTLYNTLREIRLENNEITRIDADTFLGCTLNILVLRDNFLGTITADAFNGINIMDYDGILDLSNNKIRNIHKDAFQNAKIKSIYFYGNENLTVNSSYWKLSPSTKIYNN